MASMSEAAAWEALKGLGDTALEHGGIQGVLQMFISTLTFADQVARESDETGNSEGTISETISTWLTSTYVPALQQELSDQPDTK